MNVSEIDKTVIDLAKEIDDANKREQFMLQMAQYTGDEEVISSVEYMDAMNRLRGDSTLMKLMTGFPGLDQITEGFWEGNVIVVSGPTKEGKTTLCQSFTMSFIEQGIQCLWFPFDTPGDELISRFKNPPVFYLPRRNPAEKKLDWIEKKIIEGIAKYGTRVAFIDHLAMLTRATQNERNYATELQSIMMELKQIAIRWRVVLIVNHHIKKIETNSFPMLSDLKDSSGVAQDSDMVLMVWRKKGKGKSGITMNNEAILSVQANRRTGRTGVLDLVHDGDHFIQKDPNAAVDLSQLEESE